MKWLKITLTLIQLGLFINLFYNLNLLNVLISSIFLILIQEIKEKKLPKAENNKTDE